MTEIRKLKQRKSRAAARYILTVALVIEKNERLKHIAKNERPIGLSILTK
jgi:hypothetical protein